MAGLQLSGLASGFDWKTLVDQLMNAERAPINKLTTEKTTNTSKSSAFTDLQAKLTALNASAAALDVSGLFGTRKAVSTTTGSTWNPSVAANTTAGSYRFNVTQLATASRLTGVADIGSTLNTSNDVSGLTLASLPTATAVTAGNFTVNGQKVTIALTDSLEDVFTAISTATGGAVTASYDNLTDKISLNSASPPIVLGAANDTSNILSVLKLTNNGTGVVTSSSELGAVSRNAVLANSRLKVPITAVDGSGNGTFTINGVSINYNVNTDSLSAVLQRINQAGAGVTASYDGASDRVVLNNSITGNMGLSVSEAAGGLMDALGLTTGATLAQGVNAEFTLDNGATLTSMSNTLSATAHGIEGLDLTVDTLSAQTITVSGDTSKMRAPIEDFIAKFNDVQKFIDEKTKITSKDGKVTTALLANNREIQSWASSLRSIAFGAVSGLSGTISRLENMGIDFKSGTSELEIKSGTKLDTALRDRANEVADYFQTATTGLSEMLQGFLTKASDLNTKQQAQFTKSNTDIDRQVEVIERRLTQQRAILESSFIAMETAQSKLQTQSAALTKAFP